MSSPYFGKMPAVCGQCGQTLSSQRKLPAHKKRCLAHGKHVKASVSVLKSGKIRNEEIK